MRNGFWARLFRTWVYWLLKPQYLILNCKFFKDKAALKKMLTFAHKHGIKVLTYTANTPEDWYNALEYKFDGVITDFPQEACRILTNHTGVAQGKHSS